MFKNFGDKFFFIKIVIIAFFGIGLITLLFISFYNYKNQLSFGKIIMGYSGYSDRSNSYRSGRSNLRGSSSNRAGKSITSPDKSKIKNPVAINVSSDGKTIRIDIDTFEKVGAELLQNGPLIVAIVAADNKIQNYDTDLQRLAKITNPSVTKIVGLSSYSTLSQKLADSDHVSYLKSIGVSGFTYNTESQHTPSTEMSSLKVVGDSNYVVKFAKLASSNGFKPYWVPAGERILNSVGIDALKSMFVAGLKGVVIQEQRRIEAACPSDRADAVNQWIDKFKSADNNAEIGVQLMTERCLTADAFAKNNCSGVSDVVWGSCDAFINILGSNVDFISIWAPSKQNLDDLINFSKIIR